MPQEELLTAAARFAGRTPLDAAALALLRSRGEVWRVTLPRALHGTDHAQVVASRRLDRTDGRYLVPLPLVVGAERFEGKVSLHLSAGDVVQVEPSGLARRPPRRTPRGARLRHLHLWRTPCRAGGAQSSPGARRARRTHRRR